MKLRWWKTADEWRTEIVRRAYNHATEIKVLQDRIAGLEASLAIAKDDLRRANQQREEWRRKALGVGQR
jgi:hypothetical protein